MLLPPPPHVKRTSQSTRNGLVSSLSGTRGDHLEVHSREQSSRSSMSSPPSSGTSSYGLRLQSSVPTITLRPDDLSRRPPPVRTSLPPASHASSRYKQTGTRTMASVRGAIKGGHNHGQPSAFDETALARPARVGQSPGDFQQAETSAIPTVDARNTSRSSQRVGHVHVLEHSEESKLFLPHRSAKPADLKPTPSRDRGSTTSHLVPPGTSLRTILTNLRPCILKPPWFLAMVYC